MSQYHRVIQYSHIRIRYPESFGDMHQNGSALAPSGRRVHSAKRRSVHNILQNWAGQRLSGDARARAIASSRRLATGCAAEQRQSLKFTKQVCGFLETTILNIATHILVHIHIRSIQCVHQSLETTYPHRSISRMDNTHTIIKCTYSYLHVHTDMYEYRHTSISVVTYQLGPAATMVSPRWSARTSRTEDLMWGTRCSCSTNWIYATRSGLAADGESSASAPLADGCALTRSCSNGLHARRAMTSRSSGSTNSHTGRAPRSTTRWSASEPEAAVSFISLPTRGVVLPHEPIDERARIACISRKIEANPSEPKP